MQKNRWSRKFDWVKSGNTYQQQTRSEFYDENRVIAVDDIYFRLNKYLTGVTFTYINSLNNVYKKDLLTGDGYSIVNMYNEYDVIDAFMKNIIEVDVASNVDINISVQWKVLDGVKLKPGHLVLLKSQNSEFENDVYRVDNNYLLQNAGFLSSREKSFRFSCSVKMGSDADNQYFLVNNGYEFPIIGEPKYFIIGRSLILKNLINYGLSDIDYSLMPKMIFTDYDLARKQLSQNSELYYDYNFVTNIIAPSSIFMKIDYHNDSYVIRSGSTSCDCFTGLTSNITISPNTCIPFVKSFDYKIGDYIRLTINSGTSTLLKIDSYIKTTIYKNAINYLVLEETIPARILNDLKYTTFEVENLQVATNWTNAVNRMCCTPYSIFFEVITGLTNTLMSVKIKPKMCEYNKYFDYDALHFSFEDDYYSFSFQTLNPYIKYKLFNILNNINPIFTSEFTFFNEYKLDSLNFNYNYTDNSRIKISTTVSGLTGIFKPYTYVNVSGSSITGKTLVYSVSEYEIVIEKPLNWTYNSNLLSIQNIDGLENISDLLYSVYINETYDWYIQKTDNERKYIAKSYAELLTLNLDFRTYVTGILYENEDNEFILKLYDLGPSVAGSSNPDENLFFSTIDVIYVGSDRKTRLPVSTIANSGQTLSKYPMRVSSGATFNDENYSVLNGGTDDVLSGIDGYILGDVIYGGFDDVLPGPPLDLSLIYTMIDGGFDTV
jgi:hypothetical protein